MRSLLKRSLVAGVLLLGETAAFMPDTVAAVYAAMETTEGEGVQSVWWIRPEFDTSFELRQANGDHNAASIQSHDFR